jgi:hypothetical protein
LNKNLPAPPLAGQAKGALKSAAEFVGTNTPGIDAGSGAGVNEAGNVASAVGSWPNGPTVPTAVSQDLTFASSALGGAADLYQLGKGLKQTPQAYRTMNDPNATRAAQYEAEQKFKSGLIDHGTQLVDAASQATNIAGTVVGGTVAQAAPFLGAFVSAGVTGQAGKRAWEAKSQRDALDKTLGSLNDTSLPEYSKLRDSAVYARGQMQKRFERQTAGAVGAAASTVGGGLVGGSLLAGPAAPALAAGGAVGMAAGSTVAGGLTAVKVVHNLQKRATDQLGVDRTYHADNLMNLLGNQDPTTRQFAEQIVGNIGLNPDDLRSDPEKGKKLLQDQLSSW